MFVLNTLIFVVVFVLFEWMCEAVFSNNFWIDIVWFVV